MTDTATGSDSVSDNQPENMKEYVEGRRSKKRILLDEEKDRLLEPPFKKPRISDVEKIRLIKEQRELLKQLEMLETERLTRQIKTLEKENMSLRKRNKSVNKDNMRLKKKKKEMKRKLEELIAEKT